MSISTDLTLINLPEDCIIEILKKCDGKSVINCRMTCKTLNEISHRRSISEKMALNIRKITNTNEILISLLDYALVKNRSYWQIILQSAESLMENIDIRPILLYSLRFLGKSLEIRNCRITLINGNLILESFKGSLESLTINNSPTTTSTFDLTDELSSFDNLKTLTMIQNGINFLSVLQNRCQNLSDLSLINVTSLKEQRLLFDQFFITLPNLKKLRLKNLDGISIFQLDGASCQLDYFEIDNVDFLAIENLKKFLELQAPSLEFFKISIKHVRAFNDDEINLWKDIFKAICACTKLKTLVILSPNKLVPDWTFMEKVLNKTVEKLIIKDVKYSGILNAFAKSLLSLNSIDYDMEDTEFQLKNVDWKILKILKLNTAISSFNFAPILMPEDIDEFLKTTIAFLAKNPNIEVLTIEVVKDDILKNEVKLPAEFFRMILTTLPKLTTLKLTNINDVHLFQMIIGEYTHNIKSVSVQGFYNKTVYEIISTYDKKLYLNMSKTQENQQ